MVGDGDDRPGSTPESQIEEESGGGGGKGRGGQVTRGARRRTQLIFWKRTAGAAFRGIVMPVYLAWPMNAR
jgi:hypothetical protein